MNIVETAIHADMSVKAAEAIIAVVRARPASVLVLPTGETPRQLFGELIAARRSGAADFSRVQFVALDEYAGIKRDDPRGLTPWLWRELLEPLGIQPKQVHAFDPDPARAVATITRIETTIVEIGGIDLAVLGLGMNGHLGFNEPGSALDGRTHVVALAPSSIAAGVAAWGTEANVPRSAITLGLGTIREARRLLLIVSGRRKAAILAKVLTGPIGPTVPATMIREHPDATVIADREALTDYRG